MRHNEKKIDKWMMEWRDENDEMEDDGRMMKIWKSGSDERIFKEKRKHLKYK